jgi:hypothetical protein
MLLTFDHPMARCFIDPITDAHRYPNCHGVGVDCSIKRWYATSKLYAQMDERALEAPKETRGRFGQGNNQGTRAPATEFLWR